MKGTAFILCMTVMALGWGAGAQSFSAYPPSTRWKQIDSDTARIIFTAGAEAQAAKVAALVNKAAADTPFALGKGLRKINIVLHSHTTLANGYVGLAPFRSEYYLIPPSHVFGFGNLPWYKNLAVHEYRHVQQYNNLRNGVSKGLYYLFGEQGLALGNGLSVPDWFFEGDAVHSETALTHSGRGRLSGFLSSYNSLFLEHKNYSWQKLRNGSLKDYVPDHYPLGYLLVNYGYLKYGSDFWGQVIRDASAFKGLFYPFQKAVNRYAGVDFKTFRKEAFDYYRARLPRLNDTTAGAGAKTVTNYYFPQYIGPDSLLYLKSSYRKIPAFYIKDGAGEHKIALRHISSEEWFSYRNGIIAYTAYSTHARWSLTDYSDIILLNVKNKRSGRITNRKRYFTPDFSPSGNKLCAIFINDSLLTELHLLQPHGTVEKVIKAKANEYLTNPRFVDENRIVVGVRGDNEKQALEIVDIRTGQWEVLLPENYNTVGNPFVWNGTVYFTANFSGNDEIYSLNPDSRKLLQLTQSATGNYFPSADGRRMIWSHFTAGGLLIEKKSLDLTDAKEIRISSIGNHPDIYPVAGGIRSFTTLPRERFAMKRYDKGTGLFNFHSWSPDYEDPEFTVSLLGNNILNTFTSQLYYRYNQNEASHALGFSAAYGGWFPVLSLGGEYNFNRQIKRPTETITLDGAEARIGYSLPFNFTRGTSYKTLRFGSDFVFNRTIFTGASKAKYKGYDVSYLSHNISWAHYRPKAVQQIYSKLGYVVSSGVKHLLNRNGYQVITAANLFLPSFGNHSIVLSGAFQQTDTANTVFSNRFAASRGYEDYYFSRMWKLGANYHFPILYPDFGLASIVYFQRLRGNLFYDFTRVFNNKRTTSLDLRSTGAELFFDTKWWNQLPITFGIRYSYLIDADITGNSRSNFSVILPLDLIP